ncbi:MAG: hypothetical protein K0S55_1818 [Clostridia bacterium]|nr:hypothetical protein [Clostridia bacterium]
MSKEVIDLKSEIRQFEFDMQFLQKIDCSREENIQFSRMIKNKEALPEGIFQYKTDVGADLEIFYRIYETELTNEEKQKYLQYKQLSSLQSIKNSMIFFVVLTVISLIISLLAVLSR